MMLKRGLLASLFILTLIGQVFYPSGKIAYSPLPVAFEGTGPVLQSRVITQSSLDTFNKKEVVLSSYQYASDKIECPVPEDSVVYGTFGPVAWADLYWTTRDYQSPIKEGVALFSNKIFQIRYTPLVGAYHFRVNNTYPLISQNFTVPSTYNDFEVRYIWTVVRVSSGSAKFHAEIWNYGMISVGTSTESVNVTGPYDWWVAMKMMSPRTLAAGGLYKLNVVWENGSDLDVMIMTDIKDADDNAQGNVSFFNSTSGNEEVIGGRMLTGIFTCPASNTYSISFGTWSKALPLRNCRLYLHGRNIPGSNISMKVNSLDFGTGEVPAIRLGYALEELAFWVTVKGSRDFSGGTVDISSDLISVEQSRTHYDKYHLPPFYRPFASLSIFTDNAGKPWGEWTISGGAWKAYVIDFYGNPHPLPAERVEQREQAQKVVYPLLFYPPASPSYGFLNLTVRFNYTIEAFSVGPEFNSSYTVSPRSDAFWNISNPLISFRATPQSSITIKIGPVPRDWVVQRANVTPGAGGGKPTVSILDDDITISGILTGSSNTYSGRVEIYVKADNYLESQAAYIRFRQAGVLSTFFLQNDSIRIEVRAASSAPSFPPGLVDITVRGPEGFALHRSVNQLDQEGAVADKISLSKVGWYLVSATYKSDDGLSVGFSGSSFKILTVSATVDKDIVLLSSSNATVELDSSDISSISSARFVLTSPNGSTRTVDLDRVGGRFIKGLSFPQTDPHAIGNWSIAPSISFPDGTERQLPKLSLVLADDIPPVISNITRLPKQVTFIDEVNISCTVTDKGTGVASVWISYSSGGVTRTVPAKLVGPDTYSAAIPSQPPFTRVSYNIYAIDFSGNVTSENLAYDVGMPMRLWGVLVLALTSAILVAWLYVGRRRAPPIPPPPPTTNEPMATQK